MNSKTTKRALLGSLTSLVLCFAMLIGSTFAWFTDTATTSVNTIQAGTLDVVLEMKEGSDWVRAEGKVLNFIKADAGKGEEVLWEPGCTYDLPEIRIVNNGNLALKYEVYLTATGGDLDLAKVLKVKMNGNELGTLEQVLAAAAVPTSGNNDYAKGKLAAKENSDEIAISLTMDENANNYYQGMKIDGIAVTVVATQDTVEYDSNGNTYDANATYPEVKKVASNEELENALTEDKENITVVLTSDVTIDIKPWEELPFGGDTTKSITIDGCGNYTLTFNKTNSDWNHVTTKNNATLVLKNLTLTDSGYNSGYVSGTWNSHDLNFDCPVVMENVECTKAVALKNDATLKNVTIDESKNSNAVYALWITADGQTITLDNVNINATGGNGRAIAIKDEYVANPAKVTLNIKDSVIKSDSKAAVLVTSTAGATINAENVDISAVTADKTNLVWIDEKNPNAPVTVTGGTCVTES